MKNIFKLMGIALIAGGLFAACGGNEEETKDNVPEGFNVTLDGAAVVATPVEEGASYYQTLGAISFEQWGDEQGYIPGFQSAFYLTEKGTAEGTIQSEGGLPSFATSTKIGFVYFYKDTYLSDNQGYVYGDWWAKTAKYEVVNIDLTALTVSATCEGQAFNAGEALVPDLGAVGVDAATSAPYAISFGKVTMQQK